MRATIALFCFFFSVLSGQSAWYMEPNGDTITRSLSSGNYRAGEVLAGLPYSAERVTNEIFTKIDGKHVTVPEKREKICRDSVGRTWAEVLVSNEDQTHRFMVIEIRDPVGGWAYDLDPSNKIAHRVTLTVPPAGAMAPRRPTEAPKETRTIEGLVAERKSTQLSIVARSIPWDVWRTLKTDEWSSPELKVVLQSTFISYDQVCCYRYESRMRLTNVSRTEPDSALLMPPVGYVIVDEKDTFKIVVKKQ
jgi:hypothetical protein